MTEKHKTVALVALVAVGMLVGIAGAVPGVNSVSAQEDTPTDTPEEDTPEEDTPIEDTPTETPVENQTENQTADVTIENQTSNGTAVMANSTTLPEGGFLVAYNTTMSMPLGNSSFIESGSQENVSITFNQTLTQNETLVVFAFQDTNANQQFDLGTDEVYLISGEPVVDTAIVNVTAADGNVTTPTPTTPTPTPAE